MDDYQILTLYRDFTGQCDVCGHDFSIPFLLASDLNELDDNGNRIFRIIGELQNDKTNMGHRVRCKNCNQLMNTIRVYDEIDISPLLNQGVNNVA